ncbi:hypothetical protein N9L76_03420 [bacterium]|nr:hypothetical protein [bacterium]
MPIQKTDFHFQNPRFSAKNESVAPEVSQAPPERLKTFAVRRRRVSSPEVTSTEDENVVEGPAFHERQVRMMT